MSEVKYHINPETGEPGLCTATIRECRYKLSSEEHYPTADAAREAYSKTQESFKTLTKTSVTIQKLSKRDFIRELTDVDAKIKNDIMNLLDERGNWTPFKVGDRLFVNREFNFKNKNVYSLQEISVEKDDQKIFLNVVGTADVNSEGKKTLEINDLDDEIKPIIEDFVIQKNVLKYDELTKGHRKIIDSFLKLPYLEGQNSFDSIRINISGASQQITFLKS